MVEITYMNKYELYLILNPILGNEGFLAESEKIKTLLESKIQAENIVVTVEGVKRLAYPINKSWTGCYVAIDFNLSDEGKTKLGLIEKGLNVDTDVMRYLIENQDEYLVQLAKQKLNETETKDHRELNKKAPAQKGLKVKKNCIVKHMGFRVINYKDSDFLAQFMSPYGKIFSRERTGTSAKYQRKVTKAIKRARHMALLPFTAKHMD
jgi:small subunit ribosomal protein S18